MSNSPFLNAISQAMRQKGYALKTEQTYLHWTNRLILFHGKQHIKKGFDFYARHKQKTEPTHKAWLSSI
ncbi:MAG: phage integrase N-terminal SAM-like domain-containing protein [Pseudomonas sp.]|jgi:hypothetical protein|nr:phage integrase N-terminal SAM-like domain-containing protein [Pseudomonas sp.]